MKILLLGECYSENLGDGVICETVEHLLKTHYKDVSVKKFDLSGRIAFNEYVKSHLNTAKYRWFCRVLNRVPFLIDWHPFVKAYKKADFRYNQVICSLKETLKEEYDVAIFVGGSLFMDYFAGIIFCIVRELNKKKIPVIFHACGMSYLNDEDILLLKKTFSKKNVVSISLRDSSEVFKKYFPKVEFRDTYDTAFNCCTCFESNNYKFADIGVGLICIDKYYDAQKELIKKMLLSNLSWKAFVNGSNGDYNFAKKIFYDLGVKHENINEYLLPRPVTPEGLVKEITGFNRIISFRMHSQIVASAFNIESYGLIWDGKVEEMYKRMGFPDFCCIPEDLLSNPDKIIYTRMDKKRLSENVLFSAKHSAEDLFRQIDGIHMRGNT